MSRIAGRVANLEAAWYRLNARIENGVPTAVEVRYREKLAEYEQSLVNLRDFGQETLSNGKPAGVEIGVPLGTFNVKAGES